MFNPDVSDKGKETIVRLGPPKPYKRGLGKVIAVDSCGNQFEKTVVQHMRNGQWFIDFGSYADYRLDDLLKHKAEFETDPEKGFCVDAGGLNHKRCPYVEIKAKDMLEILRKASMPVED